MRRMRKTLSIFWLHKRARRIADTAVPLIVPSTTGNPGHSPKLRFLHTTVKQIGENL